MTAKTSVTAPKAVTQETSASGIPVLSPSTIPPIRADIWSWPVKTMACTRATAKIGMPVQSTNHLDKPQIGLQVFRADQILVPLLILPGKFRRITQLGQRLLHGAFIGVHIADELLQLHPRLVPPALGHAAEHLVDIAAHQLLILWLHPSSSFNSRSTPADRWGPVVLQLAVNLPAVGSALIIFSGLRAPCLPFALQKSLALQPAEQRIQRVGVDGDPLRLQALHQGISVLGLRHLAEHADGQRTPAQLQNQGGQQILLLPHGRHLLLL